MLIDAIVIARSASREHDQFVTLYTRELGKTTAVAKSAYKPSSIQGLQLDEGNLIRCELVPGKGGSIITGAQALECHSRAKSSLSRWSAAQFFLQVIHAAVYDHQQDSELFDCLLAILRRFNAVTDQEVLSTFRNCQQELLRVLGYGGVPEAVSVSGRTTLDDAYERIAQRRLATLDLFYDLVRV